MLDYSDITLVTNEYSKQDLLSSFLNGMTFIPNKFGHQSKDPKACCGDRIIGDFEIIYFIGGEGLVTIGDAEYKCTAGDVMLITPFIKHSIQTVHDNPHDNFWIHFDISPFYRHNEFIAAFTGNAGNKVHIGLREDLLQLYLILEAEIKKESPGCRILFSSILTSIVTLCLRYNKNEFHLSQDLNSEEKTAIMDRVLVDKAAEFIFNNLDKSFRISDICSHLHISESYLFKSFLKILKLSPNRFVQLARIKHAEQLLKTTGLTFKEIAERTGFSTSLYFSNVFKKYYGMSPREYLRFIHM